jgi:diaminohydroxyphosphoribosylaminopyrimidine deaminase/5-amino-6-(5-phosphoribosylamino)uracil reductase
MSNSNQPSPREIELMQQALALAVSGRGYVEPNPMVGCIIHKDGRVIGKGFHQRFGQPHAEPNALADCSESPRGATAVVTLEPCCHTGKKTPPCVPVLMAAGIRRVVIGCLDPNPQVAGQGVAQLHAAEIEVVTGVLERECQQANAAFFAMVRERRPYVTLKWAQMADGFVAGVGGRPMRISGAESTRFVHHLRTRCDAIADLG